MRHLILGTAGHIDHGKTTLVRALTGVDTDRLEEEKRRGITIDLGFARLPLADGLEVGVIDVPGHEAFVRNMLAGATGIDLVLLVVAADEGVMPQTREHLAIVELLGVRGGVVAVTKTDLVDPDWLELVVDELREQLAHTPFARAPLVPVSAETGEGLDVLREALRESGRTVAERDNGDVFRLPVDRVFSVRGTGTVATGTIWAGQIGRDEMVRLLPSGPTARVRGIQVHGRDVETAGAGQRAALALVGVDRDQLGRGDVLVHDAGWEPSLMLTVRLRLLADTDWAIGPRQRIRFHLGTAEVMGRVVIFDADALGPGDTGWAQLRLEAPIVARAGDRFVIRSYSPVTTIGGGIVAEPRPGKRKHLGMDERDHLETVLFGTAAEAVEARANLADWRGTPFDDLSIETPHPPAAIDQAVGRLEAEQRIVRVGNRVFAIGVAARARTLFLGALDAWHHTHPLRPGMDREELRRALPAPAPPELGESVLAGLVAEGVVDARGGLVARAGFRPLLDEGQRQACEQIVGTLTEAGLMPPTLPELPETLRRRPDVQALLRLLEHEGRLVSIAPDLYLARSVIDDAILAARRALNNQSALTPADFKNVFPISRKYLIPLLEHFDRTGVTARRGDTRIQAGP